MASMPSYVQILRDGFGESRETALERTEMQGGLVKQAAVRSRVMVRRPVRAYISTRADYLNWIVFVRDTIGHGADFFDWIDPVDGATKSARIVNGIYQSSPLGPASGAWLVTFELESWGS